MNSSRTILATDIGGTRLKIGLVRAGAVLAQTVKPANSKAGLAPQLPVLASAWRQLLDEAGFSLADCAGISMAFPSVIEASTGRVLAAYGKFEDAMEIDLRAWAQKEFGLPLAIDNDARMALIGEWQVGAGRGSDDLVIVTLGTGIGVSAILEGKVLRGKHGQAGIQGSHITVRYEGGRLCTCGNVGCAEAEVWAGVLSDLAKARPDFATSALRDESVLDFEAIFRLAVAGDACAIALRGHCLRVWSALVVSLIHVYDPELVILGGGVMASGSVILPGVRDYVARHAQTPWGKVQVVPAALGDQAALLAGEWLVNEQFPNLKP